MFFSTGFSRCRLLCEWFCPTCGDCYAIATSHRTGRGKNICVVFEICPWGRLRISRAQIVTSGLASSSVQSETIQAAARRRLALRSVWPTALASSRMPTRILPQRPTSSPQWAQVTRLSAVELSGTTNLLLPHFGHLSGEACVSALIGSGMTLRPFWSVELPQERSG